MKIQLVVGESHREQLSRDRSGARKLKEIMLRGGEAVLRDKKNQQHILRMVLTNPTHLPKSREIEINQQLHNTANSPSKSCSNDQTVTTTPI